MPYIEHHERFKCPDPEGGRPYRFKIEDDQLIASVRISVGFGENGQGWMDEIVPMDHPRPAREFYHSVFDIPEVRRVESRRNPHRLRPWGLSIECIEPVFPIL